MMNLTSRSSDLKRCVISVKFNQDYSLLSVGMKTGYRIYSLNFSDFPEEIYHNEAEEAFLVETLFSSSLLAFVSASTPCRLSLFHYRQEKEIFSHSYLHNIVAVRLNRMRMVVCLEESIHLHDIHDMKHLHTIHDTPVNKHGVCALSADNDSSLFAYPGSSLLGEMNIFDAVNLRAVNSFRAHESPLAVVAFNSSGSLVSTASETGTVIRVFCVKDGQKLFEFRRGVKRSASIYSLAFSLDSVYLSCSSNTETVHIFKLSSDKDRPADETGKGWMDYFGQAIKTSATFLPTQVTEMLNQERYFSIARLPSSGTRNDCAVVSIDGTQPRLMVATQDGILFEYNINPVDGGECQLIRQHRIDGSPRKRSFEAFEQLSPSGVVGRAVQSHSNEPPLLPSSSSFHSGSTSNPPYRQSYASVLMNRPATTTTTTTTTERNETTSK